MERLDPTRTQFVQLAYGDVAQFVAYCDGLAPAPLMQSTPVAKGLDSGQQPTSALSNGIISKETVIVTVPPPPPSTTEASTTIDEPPSPTLAPTTTEVPENTEVPTTITEESTMTIEEPTTAEGSSPTETEAIDTVSPTFYEPTGETSSGLPIPTYNPSSTTSLLAPPIATGSASKTIKPSFTAFMVIIGYFLFM